MTNTFVVPEVRDLPSEIPLYRTPPPDVDSLIESTGRAFDTTGTIRDAGDRRLCADRNGILEIFDASGSVWWTKKSRRAREPRRSIAFPEEKEAIRLADGYLRQVGLDDRNAKASSVTYSNVLWEMEDGAEPTEAVAAQHVNYSFSLGRIPVWGSGAKIQVTFGTRGEVGEVLKFWRRPRRERRSARLIPIADAVGIYQSDASFADLSADRARVEIEQIDLGYFSLPPREVQGYLIPVYRFIAVATTEEYERDEFVRFVVAVEIPPDEAKMAGAAVTGAVRVL